MRGENETTGRVTGQVESASVGICAPSPKNDCLGFFFISIHLWICFVFAEDNLAKAI